MINVTLNRTEFEYDIHSLLKAFFPKEDVEIYYTPEAQAEVKNVACTNHSIEGRTVRRGKASAGTDTSEPSGDSGAAQERTVAGRLEIQYEDNSISIAWEDAPEGTARCIFAVDFSDRTAAKNALKEHL